MAAAVDRERDWSELNPELLELIAGAFTEISDRFRFRAVCRSWRSSCDHLSIRGPLLFLFPDRHSPQREEEDCHVISPFDNWRSFTLRTPYSLKMKSTYNIGSPHGCFLVIAIGSFSITNPLVPGAWFPLPPPLPNMYDYQWYFKMAKIFKSSESKFYVIISANYDSSPYLWKVGDSAWTTMYKDCESVYHNTVSDSALYKDNFYLVESSEKTVVLNSTTLEKTSEIAHPQIEIDEEGDGYMRYFLVESTLGELLMVVWNIRYDMWVFQLDSSEQQPKWIRVRNIGDDTLFLDVEGVMCFPTGGMGGFAKNCVYFIPSAVGDREVVICDIEDDSLEFLPQHVTGSQRPVWFIPSCS